MINININLQKEFEEITLYVPYKIMRLPSIFKNKKTKRSSSSWKWRPLKHLKTISFYMKAKMFNTDHTNFARASDHAGKFTTMLDSSWSQSKCFSSAPAAVAAGSSDRPSSKSGELLLENAAQAIKEKRLFFEPGSTNSILGASRFPFQDCIVQTMDTADPYVEFRFSMEEMVESYGLIKASTSRVEKDRNWEYLEGLLSWYLSMNEKKNHGFIVEAFIDMYAGLPSCPSSCYFSYNASASSSKSKDWWEININESSLQRVEKEAGPKYS